MQSQKGTSLLGVILAATIIFTGGELAFLFYLKTHPQKTPSPLPEATQQKETSSNQQSKEQPPRKKTKYQVELPADSSGLPPQTSQKPFVEKGPLEKLPSRERAELERAIRETQKVVKNSQPFNPSDLINKDHLLKGLDQVNKQSFRQQKQVATKRQDGYSPPAINYQDIWKLGNFLPGATNPQPEKPSPEELFGGYLQQHEQIPGLTSPSPPKPPPVYINPLNNPDVNPMANPKFNPMMNPNINPMADPAINPMADPAINPGCIPCQFGGQ